MPDNITTALPEGIATMLDLSTAHVYRGVSPRGLRGIPVDWGNLRVIEHDYGGIVGVPGRGACILTEENIATEGDCSTHNHETGDLWDEEDYGEGDERPTWLVPIIAYAQEHGCILINFDCDALELTCLPIYPQQ